MKITITKEELNTGIEYWLSQKHPTLVVGKVVSSVAINYDYVDILIDAPIQPEPLGTIS